MGSHQLRFTPQYLSTFRAGCTNESEILSFKVGLVHDGAKNWGCVVLPDPSPRPEGWLVFERNGAVPDTIWR